ncbi:DNA polymerase [Buchnera aphidicola]|uniref:DNA polymerase n=1 Tax=Buchnera aphidicola TaxID=9 RepID=UPI003463E5FA
MVTNTVITKYTENIKNIEYNIILKKEQFEKMLKIIEKYNNFSFIIKTNLPDIHTNNITGFSFSVIINQVFYIPIIDKNILSLKIKDKNNILKKIKNLFENHNQLKIGHNIKNNYHLLKKYNIKLSGNTFDTMIASYVLNNTHKNHIKIEELENLWIQNNKKKNTNREKNIGQESEINLKIYIVMLLYLNKEEKIKKIIENIEIPLVKIIANIEENGILINIKQLKEQSKKITTQLVKLKHDAYQLTGTSFNILSSQQLKKNLLIIKNRKNSVTSNIKKNDMLLNIVKNYRSLYKLKSTYIDPLPKRINKITGRIHTCYYQTNTLTGRLSSKNPNVQNIPSKTKEGKEIRKAFISEKNYFIVSADYSQIELRILAYVSKDKELIKAFSNDSDIYKITASEIFNIPIINVTDEQRQHAKVINFSLIYGMGPFGLSNKLNINILTAKEYIKTYFKRYRGIKKYIKHTYQFALKKGYVLTLYGRKIHIPHITSKNFLIRQSAERTAVNAAIQGTSSDIIKLAMVKIYNFFKTQHHLNAKIIMQVHDELVFEIKKEKINSICKEIRNIMESNTILDTPIPVRIKIGHNWQDTIKTI